MEWFYIMNNEYDELYLKHSWNQIDKIYIEKA